MDRKDLEPLLQRITTLEEELTSLKAKLDEKDAQVSGLTNALSTVVLAQVASHNDMAVPDYLRSMVDYDLERGRKDGNQHWSADYFFARGELTLELLMGLTGTNLLMKYWRQSIFPWVDERRYKHLKSIEARLECYADLERGNSHENE